MHPLPRSRMAATALGHRSNVIAGEITSEPEWDGRSIVTLAFAAES